MKIVIASVGILVALAINHAVHGLGCWGLRPGGKLSALLYCLQAFLAVLGLAWLLYRVTTGRGHTRYVVAGSISLVAAAAVVAHLKIGWRINTSIHSQGPENLIPFLLVALLAIMTGGYRWLTRESTPNTKAERPGVA